MFAKKKEFCVARGGILCAMRMWRHNCPPDRKPKKPSELSLAFTGDPQIRKRSPSSNAIKCTLLTVTPWNNYDCHRICCCSFLVAFLPSLESNPPSIIFNSSLEFVVSWIFRILGIMFNNLAVLFMFLPCFKEPVFHHSLFSPRQAFTH